MPPTEAILEENDDVLMFRSKEQLVWGEADLIRLIYLDGGLQEGFLAAVTSVYHPPPLFVIWSAWRTERGTFLRRPSATCSWMLIQELGHSNLQQISPEAAMVQFTSVVGAHAVEKLLSSEEKWIIQLCCF